MKNVNHLGRLLLALGLALSAASCDTPDESSPTDPGPTPPAVETHEQALSLIPVNCTVVSSTVILGQGPGVHSPLCRLTLNCWTVDANWNFHVEQRTQISICP